MSDQPQSDYYEEEYEEYQEEYQEQADEFQDQEKATVYARRQEQSRQPRLLDSWFIRLLMALVIIVCIAGGIVGGAFFQASSTRDEPLEIKAFPGMLQTSYEKVNAGHDLQTWSGTVSSLAELENHYKKQMDDCNRLFSEPEEGQESSDQTIESKNYVRTNCLLDHSHDLFGITQYVRLTIQPEFNEDGERTGPVNVTIERVWKE